MKNSQNVEISKELSKKVLDGIIKLITVDHETVEELRKEAGDDIVKYLTLRQAYYSQVVEIFTKYKDAFKKPKNSEESRES